MDRFVIIRDKKITAYILGAMFFVGVSNILAGNILNDTFANSRLPNSFLFIFVVITLYIVFLYYFILKDSMQIITFKETHMKYGTLNMMSTSYSDIEDISFDEHINIRICNKTRKIRVFNIEKNFEKYKSILETLSDRTGLEFDPGESLETLKEYNSVKYETGGHPLRLGSWVMVIFVSLIISCAANLLLMMISAFLSVVNPETVPLSIVQVVYFIVNALITIVALILMIKRMKAAIFVLKATYCLAFLYSVISTLMSFLTPELTGRKSSASLAVTIFSSLTIMLLLFRYLNVSQRVAKTFIYDKFTAVTKADRSIDPPFKLFSKEPASLYGVFSWLAFPIVFIVIFVITILFLIFTSFII